MGNWFTHDEEVNVSGNHHNFVDRLVQLTKYGPMEEITGKMFARKFVLFHLI